MPPYWYMLPVAMCIATVALTSGVAGATFFTPLFLLWLGLPLRVAIAASLLTATFGFASGLAGYYRRGSIDFRLGGRLLTTSLPMALTGVWLATRIDQDLLRAILGVGLLAIALSFLRRGPAADYGTRVPGADAHRGGAPWEGLLFAGAGGLALGAISAGLGELNAYYLIRRRGLPVDTAVATSVLVVAVTVPVAAAGHLLTLLSLDAAARGEVGRLVMFTIPGVVIGAQIGCHLGTRAPRRLLLRFLGVLFIVVAALVLNPVLRG